MIGSHTGFQIAIIIVISGMAAGVSWLSKKPETENPPAVICDPTKIKADEICFDQISGNVLWVDARSRDEWETNGHPESILWNLDPKENQQTFEAEAALKIMEAAQVVVYCGSQACDTSRQVAKRIRSLELGPEVKVLHGGHQALPLNKKR